MHGLHNFSYCRQKKKLFLSTLNIPSIQSKSKVQRGITVLLCLDWCLIELLCSLIQEDFESRSTTPEDEPDEEDLTGNEGMVEVDSRSLFQCMVCQRNFISQVEFFLHLKSHYEPKNKKTGSNTFYFCRRYVFEKKLQYFYQFSKFRLSFIFLFCSIPLLFEHNIP